MNIVHQNDRIVSCTAYPFASHDFLMETPEGKEPATCRFHLGAGPCSHGLSLDRPSGSAEEEEAVARRRERQEGPHLLSVALDMAMEEGTSKTDDGDFIFIFRRSRVEALEAELAALAKRLEEGAIIPAVIVRSAGK